MLSTLETGFKRTVKFYAFGDLDIALLTRSLRVEHAGAYMYT